MRPFALLVAALLLAPLAAQAEISTFASGGDVHLAGDRVDETLAAPRDAFAAAPFLTLRGRVGEDAHAAGFSVLVEGDVGGDLYAAGANVVVEAAVGGDASLAGGSVVLSGPGSVGGNLRVMAGSVTLAAPGAGSLAVSGGEVRLDAPVGGDLHVASGALSFGEGARIDGRLVYAGPERIDVPAGVVPASRIEYRGRRDGGWRDAGDLVRDGLPDRPSPLIVGTGFLLGLGFLLIVGALLLALMPGQVRRMRVLAHARPALTILIGFAGFSAIVGLVPVSLMTLVGIPLMPFALLLAVLAWLLGYLLGVYVVAMAAARGLGMADAPPIWARLMVLAGGIVLAALLNFVPFLGWMANLALVFLGVGAMFDAAFQSAMPQAAPAYDDAMEETPG